MASVNGLGVYGEIDLKCRRNFDILSSGYISTVYSLEYERNDLILVAISKNQAVL